jgi:hypothetical protein
MKHVSDKLFQKRSARFKNIVAILILGVTGAVHAQQYTFTTTVGPIGNGSGSADGTGSDAQFILTFGVAVDAGGNVYRRSRRAECASASCDCFRGSAPG